MMANEFDDDRAKENLLQTARQLELLTGAGGVAAVDPDDADAMGAFEEDALDPEDALDSRFDDEADDDGSEFDE